MGSKARRLVQKTEALRIHAKRKARERYGLELTDEELRQLANRIRKGEAVFVLRKSLRVSCWKVAYRGCELVALYDRSRRAIVTFLPADCREIRQYNAPDEGPSLPQGGAVI